MTSKIKVNILADGGDNAIITSDGAGAVTFGTSGDSITIPSGVTITNNGTQTGFGGENTPAFFVRKDGDQDIVDDAWTKLTGFTEVLDTDNCFASNKFTPTTAGKYIIYGAATVSSVTTLTNLRAAYSAIYKNGSLYAFSDNNYNGSFIYNATLFIQTVVDFNGSTDYVELYANGDLTTGNPRVISTAYNQTFLGGYKIIGA